MPPPPACQPACMSACLPCPALAGPAVLCRHVVKLWTGLRLLDKVASLLLLTCPLPMLPAPAATTSLAGLASRRALLIARPASAQRWSACR